MLPALKLGSATRFLAADSAWRLLAVTVAGDVRVLDLQALSSTLDTSLAPLLSGAPAATQGEGPAAMTMLHPGVCWARTCGLVSSMQVEGPSGSGQHFAGLAGVTTDQRAAGTQRRGACPRICCRQGLATAKLGMHQCLADQSQGPACSEFNHRQQLGLLHGGLHGLPAPSQHLCDHMASMLS